MPGAILFAGATIQCPHGGQAAIVPSNQKVTLGGQPALLITDVMTIQACPFTLPSTTPSPCLTIQWTAPSTAVTLNGQSVLLMSSQGLCMNAQSAPQGTAIINNNQTAATAT